jgi:signal transduction histidine kinase/CheY-like chemotaxis protein
VLNRVALWSSNLLAVQSADPEQRRKGRLLGVFILGSLVAASALTLVNLIQIVGGVSTKVEFYLLTDLIMCLIIIGIWRLNYVGKTRLASYAYLIVLEMAVASVFSAQSLDRVMLIYVLPTMAASFLLTPASSFIFVVLSVLSYTAIYIGQNVTLDYNYVSVIGLFFMALIAWLAASNLENALREIRHRAEELDHRVNERTSDLADALAREHAEASKTQAILQSIGDGVIVFDQNQEAIVVNPAASSILDCAETDVLGQDVSSMMGQAVNEDDQAILRSMIADTGLSRAGLKVAWGRKTVAVGFAPVKLPQVDQFGTVMVLRDITKEAEVDRMKSEFVSMVSHELRTPMTAIKGYMELLLMGRAGGDPQMQRNFMEVVKANADRLGEMVDELLDVSRIEAGRIQMRFQAVSMHRTVHDVTTMLQKALGNKGVELRLNVPDDLPPVLADPGRLTQVVTNLIANALKYTLEGHIDVMAEIVGDYVQVDVSDTGIGMTEEDQGKLFTRFFRASTARDSEIPGTGLGLSITRSLIEMHGGRIWVKSTVGRGSTFSFTLPILPKSLAQLASSAPTPSIMARTGVASPKILVVDDELQTAQKIRHQLEAEDYTVLITTHGKDVLPLARREKPNLILLDILIQDANGIEVLHQLKQDQDTRNIPVIVTSVGAKDQKGFALGATDYLTQPIDEHQLLAGLRQALAPANSATPR